MRFNQYYLTEDKENKPDIFTHTIYRSPTNEELVNVNSFKLSSKEILNGFYYTMVGKGVLNKQTKNRIVAAIDCLIKLYPNNKEYENALSDAKQLHLFKI